ncbi:acyltransferase [Rhodopseudomonas boonkerdii]|uniref:acyltransferase family protein n=1 Tax=Rhodopseudomonas boonkerdii TaxID=475937 RepID=UPI001E63A863|nr:acyltransferase [Rhodopseudomonas boonkerdii]UGV26980.1 acyltransferase [Rhodopseudomonas boonkerdii]
MFGAVLSERLQSDRNSFNLVRLAAAASVIVSHLFILRYGPGTPEPLSSATPFTLGQHAVNLFFVLSGLLASRSLDRNPDLRQFAVARLLRIVPALFVYGLVFAIIAGPLLTAATLTGYFVDIKTWTYPVTVLARFQQAPAPPGLFDDLPYAFAVNEPLWTLKYEMAAYAGLGVAQAIGLRRSVPFLMLSLVVTAGGIVAMQPGLHSVEGTLWPYHLSRYGLCFLLGVLAHRGRDLLPVTPWLMPISLTAAVAFAGTSLSPVTCIIATAHVAVVAGAADFGTATRWTQRNDISYGTYIYGWPVQQALLTLVPGISLPVFALLSFVGVLPLAIFSWSVVERPALNYRSGRAV